MASQSTILTGRVAAITGAGRGIGKETARAFLAAGMKVAIGDVDLAAAQTTAAELGERAVAIEVNVADRASVSAFLDAAEQQLGPLDVMVNNAGIMSLGWFAEETDLAAQRMIDINIHGVINGTKEALARMTPRHHGQIVNIASQAGVFGTPGGATYLATKHAVVGLTEALRGEMRLQNTGIQLSYVLPTVVQTELGAGLNASALVKPVQPSDVADAIVSGLRKGEVDIWVPRSGRSLRRFTSLLPRRALEAIGRATKSERALAEFDAGARRDYELRAARSAPGLESAPGAAELKK